MFTQDGVRDTMREGGKRSAIAIQEAEQAELLQKLSELLVAAGYFRARLNIPPFDKIIGAMCWCITGSIYDIDIEFEDDLTLGQKIKLTEKITVALREMECPTAIAAHQIQGLDYNKCISVLQWLIQKLNESRDTRSLFNKRQGLYNYNRGFHNPADDKPKQNQQEVSNMKDIIFGGRPKRVYRTNRNIDQITLQDPKRVHQCLREFNDLSANSVFKHMLE